MLLLNNQLLRKHALAICDFKEIDAFGDGGL